MKKLVFIPLLLMISLVFAQEGYKIGDKVNDFSLKSVNNEMVSLSSYKSAKGAIIIFTCNHCPYAKLYEDRIMDLSKKMEAKGFPVIAINPNDPEKQPDDSFENMKERAEEKGYTFPYLVDETQDVAKAFGAKKTPHVFVVQRRGQDFVLKYIGAVDDNPQNAEEVDEKYVENAVDALLSGKKITKNNTRAIGCTIKWK